MLRLQDPNQSRLEKRDGISQHWFERLDKTLRRAISKGAPAQSLMESYIDFPALIPSFFPFLHGEMKGQWVLGEV